MDALDNIIENRRRWILLVLVIVGAVCRFYDLSEPGFRQNEDYAVLSARAILAEGVPRLPSGIIYPRALPLSYATAAAFGVFGESEFSARLLTATLSTLTILLVYGLGRRVFGTAVGIIAALVMALSGWEILSAQMARMYGPLSFAYLLSIYLVYRAVFEDAARFQIPALAASVLTCMLQSLGLSLALVYAALLLVPGKKVRHSVFLVAGIVTVLTTHYFVSNFEALHYDAWNTLVASATPEGAITADDHSRLQLLSDRYLVFVRSAADGIGLNFPFDTFFLIALMAATSAAILRYLMNGSLLFFAITTCFIFFVAVQQLMLATYAVTAFLVAGYVRGESRHLYKSLMLVALLATGAIAWLQYGLSAVSVGLLQAVRIVAGYPPNFLELFARAQPLLFLLSVLGGAVVCWRYAARKENPGALVVVIPFFLTATALGFHPEANFRFYDRYAFFLNPFFILVASSGVWWIAQRAMDLLQRLQFSASLHHYAGVLLATVLVLGSGAVAPSTTLAVIEAGYGQSLVNQRGVSDQYYPDHKGGAHHVCEHANADDLVITMDILGYLAYCSLADYAFTRDGKRDAEGWAGARTVEQTDAIQSIMDNTSSERIWIITAARPIMRNRQDVEIERFLLLLEGPCMTKQYAGRDGLSDVHLWSRECVAGLEDDD